MTNQCQHGQLARVCELCEHEATIANLRAQVAALEVEVREISGGAGVYMSLLVDCIAVLHTIDPDDSDEAEKLRDLLDAIDRALEPTRHKGALL